MDWPFGARYRVTHQSMIIGEYTHSLDDKKRISLPAKFRKEVGKKIVVTRGLDSCLYLYPEKQWKRIVGEVEELGIGARDKRKLSRYFIGGAQEVDVDSLGRILIPEHLRTFAQLKSKVVFIGLANRIEIWNDSTWKALQQSIEKDADQTAENLSGLTF